MTARLRSFGGAGGAWRRNRCALDHGRRGGGAGSFLIGATELMLARIKAGGASALATAGVATTIVPEWRPASRRHEGPCWDHAAVAQRPAAPDLQAGQRLLVPPQAVLPASEPVLQVLQVLAVLDQEQVLLEPALAPCSPSALAQVRAPRPVAAQASSRRDLTGHLRDVQAIPRRVGRLLRRASGRWPLASRSAASRLPFLAGALASRWRLPLSAASFWSLPDRPSLRPGEPIRGWRVSSVAAMPGRTGGRRCRAAVCSSLEPRSHPAAPLAGRRAPPPNQPQPLSSAAGDAEQTAQKGGCR